MPKMAAKGVCPACYYRFKKNGTYEYKPKREVHSCSIVGCENGVVSDGLCDKHRSRLKRNGHLDTLRPESWGAISKHPLRYRWYTIQKICGKSEIADEWKDNFLQFATDVGDPPSNKHRLFRLDQTKPIGPDNFTWRLSITQKHDGESVLEHRARAQRDNRALRPEAHKGYHLKKYKLKQHLDINVYNDMYDAQDGKCAICGEEETRIIRGKKLSLAIDHCHETMNIRGLLCGSCNHGLGHFRDRIDLLESAIAYLKKSRLKVVA
jgi:hypothetical protein